MEGERATGDLQSLLQAIRASEVVENRIKLINQLAHVDLQEKSDLPSLVECLSTLWEEFTCLDASQCMLNKTILNVAVKYLELDISGCLGQILALGTKASIWCGKHIKMTLISSEDPQDEEHDNVFFQLVVDLLSFSTSSFSALTKLPVPQEKVIILMVEKFVSEQLSLMKASISEFKRIPSIASEVLKVTQVVIDAVVRLCRAYSEVLNWDSCNVRTEQDNGSTDRENNDTVNHVINIIGLTIESLYKLGILAANGGGSMVTILNVSWKGVVTLLQLGKGVLASKVNVADVMLSLISLATESLRCAAEAWFATLDETIAITEARRTFLPVKFYLINAVRISSQYPFQALNVYREISRCILIITSFGISLSRENHLKAASKALGELLEPTSSLLLHTLLCSAEVEPESKFKILDWLFMGESDSSNMVSEETITNTRTSIVEMLSMDIEDIPKARNLMLGRVALFLNLLKSSVDFEEDLELLMSRKLDWLLGSLMEENVYSSVLVLHIPMVYGSESTVELSSILHALKTFMIVTSSGPTWGVVETFLLENLLHSHFLCREIIMELWCFVVRHAEIDMVNDIFNKLYLLFKLVASSEPSLMPNSALRKMAGSICMLVSYATKFMIDKIYNTFASEDGSQLSSIMCIALLMEGFPLDFLSENLKKIAIKRITTAYVDFIERNIENIQFDSLSRSCISNVLGAPIYALSSASHCLQINSSDIDFKTLKFTVALVRGYANATNNFMKDCCSKLLSQMLRVISQMKHLYSSDGMEEVVLELKNLFVSEITALDTRLYQCKPELASFMASMGHMELAEGEGSAKCSDVWELYHLLLREQHWALVHLTITAFGYFAARTSCNQLWRFVPQDAALSFNIETGSEANEETFMSELKAFLEKEVALLVATPSIEQLGLLAKEGLMLKETVNRISSVNPLDLGSEIMKVDEEIQATKKRKIPDRISEGMTLLQNGLKAMGDGLALWRKQHSDSRELQDKFSTHLSCLEDALAQLADLADTE
uniref:Uncharacterized protein n=1 Tax=Nelumbo nucifera TaxID=4432 RepID=A0A822XLT5_NELNU|nr:TPA_asm: hypothetical protein HUJ06_021624 [Nelumbo nucifera]